MNRRAVAGITAVMVLVAFAALFWVKDRRQSGNAECSKEEEALRPETRPENAAAEEDPGEGTLIWQGETYKRNAHVKADLLMGIDPQGAADALFVAAHDTSKNTLKLLMIPRDSMMEMNRVDEQGNVQAVITHITLSHSGPGTPEEAAKRTVDAVEALLCGTKVDHYMAADVSLLAQINDLAGGVTVIVPNEELEKADPAWKKGEQIVLHGADAERFIRYRDTAVDGTPLLRMEQHRAYIAGFYKKLKENKNLAVKISDHIEDAVTSDMSKGEYEKLLLDGLMCGFDPQTDVLILPGSMTTGVEEGTARDQYYISYEKAIPVLLDLFYRKVN